MGNNALFRHLLLACVFSLPLTSSYAHGARINGACGTANNTLTSVAPTSNLCAEGFASSIAGTGPWSWSCHGGHRGTTAQCSAPLLTASGTTSSIQINGVCGASNGANFTSTPTTGLCGTGTASTVSGSGPWSWSCTGSNGGATASCSALLTAASPTTASPTTSSVTQKHYVFGHYSTPIFYSATDLNDANAGNWTPQGVDEMNAVMEEGLDGLIYDAFSAGQATIDVINAWASTADSVGAKNFKTFLSFDMSVNIAAADMVSAVLALGNNPHYFRMNGKPVVSTYGGQTLGDSWWRDNVLQPLAAAGMPVTFIPNFVVSDLNFVAPNLANWTNVVNTYPSVDGLFLFGIPAAPPFYETDPNIGHYWWSALSGSEAFATALHNAGKIFMAPYTPSVWSVCHSARGYIETQGGLGMANWWNSIINTQQADLVDLVTWNDYTESTFMSPSTYNQLPTQSTGVETETHIGYYELAKYYISWYRYGVQPAITKDGMFYFHRTQPMNAAIANDASGGCGMGPVVPGQLFGLLQDDIYVTTALTAPATLTVTSGNTTQSFSVAAGVNTTKVPFSPGAQTLQLLRNGTLLTQASSHNINGNPTSDNYNVYSGYSIAGGKSSATWQPSNQWLTGNSGAWFTTP
jgi:glucan endo-1,3-alpha-glucosidase